MAVDNCDVSNNFMSLLTNQLAQSGNIAQNGFITIQKAHDYDYLEGKHNVSLQESLGAREVASRESMAGKPSPQG